MRSKTMNRNQYLAIFAILAVLVGGAAIFLASCELDSPYLEVIQERIEEDEEEAGLIPSYSVLYNGNGNTGGLAPTDSTEYIEGDTATVLGNTNGLVKTGYTFVGWNTKEDGSGTDYVGSDTLLMGAEDVTLYALWTTAPTYTVTYYGNGSDGGEVPVDTNDYLAGASVDILGAGAMTRMGYTFAGWNTVSDGTGLPRIAGNSYSMGSTDMELYAQWQINTHTVSYSGNLNTGGNVPMEPTEYNYGATVTVLGNINSLSRSPFVFDGWNTASDGTGTPYSGSDTFSMPDNDVNLYAIWKPIEVVWGLASQNYGISGLADSTVLAFLFSVDPTTLTVDDISITGATKGTLTDLGKTKVLGISNITVANAQTVEVTITSPTGYLLSGSPKTVVVYKAVIGTAHQGGVVGYFLKLGDPGYVTGEAHGLIVATEDQSEGVAWIIGGTTQTTLNGGTSTAFGSGQANTTAMKNQVGFTGGAAKVCDDYVNIDTGTGVYSDWYLPSKDELQKLYWNRVAIGGFSTSGYYWTSSEGGTALFSWRQSFNTGTVYNNTKSLSSRVRAIRTF
jgi:uncharacterized repeat protein (TIGR02543 family)